MRGLGLAEAGLPTGETQGGLDLGTIGGLKMVFSLVHSLRCLPAGANHAWCSRYSWLSWGRDLSLCP